MTSIIAASDPNRLPACYFMYHIIISRPIINTIAFLLLASVTSYWRYQSYLAERRSTDGDDYDDDSD